QALPPHVGGVSNARPQAVRLSCWCLASAASRKSPYRCRKPAGVPVGRGPARKKAPGRLRCLAAHRASTRDSDALPAPDRKAPTSPRPARQATTPAIRRAVLAWIYADASGPSTFMAKTAFSLVSKVL